LSKVFVLDTNHIPLDPVHPGRARLLLSQGKAAVFRRYPFTIILKTAVTHPQVQPLRVKIDPGSKTTGLAVVNDATGEVIFAANLEHRGQLIKKRLDERRAVRRSRRNRNTRYRKARWQNRRRPKGWLPPSLESRLSNITTWVNRLSWYCPITAISMELVKFDTQKLENPEISGVEYQQGTLAGYETREYLLEKWGRKCVYCGKTDIPLQIEHIQPRAKGGTDRISNLCLACEKCNIAKGTQDIRDFLKKKPEVLKRVLAQVKAPLKDTSAVNATRWSLYERLKATGLPVECGSGGLTKFNRTMRELPKDHWIDAANVGRITPEHLDIASVRPLHIKAMGSGKRQMCQPDKFGFPAKHRQRQKRYFGIQTGDIVRAKQMHTGRVTIEASGQFHIKRGKEKIKFSYKYCQTLQKNDRYQYSFLL
jgi:5-methylcytosine-specific restriction endonuclease McrA